MQVLVVDTNILWSASPFEESVAWKNLLLYAAKYSAADFVVPEVVVHERARQEADRIAGRRTEGTRALGKARAAFASAGINFPDTPTVQELRALVLESRQDIYERMRAALTAADITVSPIPTMAHETLVSWSIDAHPPFDSTDKGYRDALIWRTVREVAAALPDGATILFVTADSDYTQKPNKKSAATIETKEFVLHPRLAADLCQVTSNIVTVVRSFEEAAAVLIQWDRAEEDRGPQQRDKRTGDGQKTGEQLADEGREDELADFDVRPMWEELLRDKIEGACLELVGEEIGPSYEGFAPYFEFEIADVESATVTAVTPNLPTVSIDVHERFEGETVIGDVSVEAEVLYEGFVFKADAYPDTRPWTVVDSDWNDHYVLVEGELLTELKYRFVVNNEDVTLEFDGVQIYG